MCGANDSRLDNDIVDGIDVEKLPDCPYFSIISPIRETLSKTRVVVPIAIKQERNRERRPYSSPEIRLTAEQTDAEILQVIMDFHKQWRKWPSQRQIYLKCRLKSMGDVWNVLERMRQSGKILKTRRRRMYVYSPIVLGNSGEVQLPEVAATA